MGDPWGHEKCYTGTRYVHVPLAPWQKLTLHSTACLVQALLGPILLPDYYPHWILLRNVRHPLPLFGKPG